MPTDVSDTSAVKNLFSKTQEAQFNEVLCKVLCHNIVVLIHEMFELGIDINFVSESEPKYGVS